MNIIFAVFIFEQDIIIGILLYKLYTIRINLTINANGNVFSPVLIIQDERMDSEAFEVIRVPGLGATAELGSEGFVVFLKSRTGSRAFYNWGFSSLIVEAVQRVNQSYPDLRDTPAFWKLDGERVQIANKQCGTTTFTLKSHPTAVQGTIKSAIAVTSSKQSMTGSSTAGHVNDAERRQGRHLRGRAGSVHYRHELKPLSSTTGSADKDKPKDSKEAATKKVTCFNCNEIGHYQMSLSKEIDSSEGDTRVYFPV
jgi:hypothetical protein